jgi:hypothetical protein
MLNNYLQVFYNLSKFCLRTTTKHSAKLSASMRSPLTHLSKNTLLPHHFGHTSMAGTSRSWLAPHDLRRSRIQKPVGLVAVFRRLILAFETSPHLASYVDHLNINLVNSSAQFQWPGFSSSCVSILRQLTRLRDLRLLGLLGVLLLGWIRHSIAVCNRHDD